MKPYVSMLLVFVILLTLCACGDTSTITTTAAPQTTTSSTGPVHSHSYQNADCTTPKTCSECGHIRGDALGHDYANGVCNRCGEADSTYKPLSGTDWRIDCFNTDGSQMEYIVLRFNEDGTAEFGAGIYDRLADVPEEERDDFMLNEDNWYDYSGEIYYYAGFGVYSPLVYTVEGNIITCTLAYDENSVFILERTAGNLLTVTYFEGQFAIIFMQVGDVLRGE